MFFGEVTHIIVARSKQLLCFLEAFVKEFFLNLQICNILVNVYCSQLIIFFICVSFLAKTECSCHESLSSGVTLSEFELR